MMPTPAKGPARLNLTTLGNRVRGLSWLVTVPIVALLIFLGWSGRDTQEQIRVASQRAVRVAELRGTISYLDEWLAMLAQMAAATGERRWADRYAEAAPKLDEAVMEAAELATPLAKAALASTMGEAHRDLMIMERRALAWVETGDLASARDLLNGPEYSYLQEVYANGSNVFGEELSRLAEKRADDLAARTRVETIGLSLSAILLGATTLSIRGRRRLQGALARTASVARTDALTELPNRRQFYEELALAIEEGHRTGLDHALLLIDLDRFKAANDAHGHPAGDELLRLVSSRLRKVLQDEQRMARLGGDEFAFVVRCDPAGPDMPQTDPGNVAERIVNALGEPFKLTGDIVAQIGASVGIGLTWGSETTVDELMHRADVALYRAKAAGRGCFRMFEAGMDASVREQALLEGELRDAIANGEIEPHFQPFVNLQTGRITGLEMLARWRHPSRGMIPPTQFISIAEDLGLIGIMTEDLMARACRAATNWPAHLVIACNVSPVQLRDPYLPTMIRSILADTGFPACRIEIEVTESALVGDFDLARSLLDELKAAGVGLALDDFGTGYSSLRHLQAFPFDKIKIDRSFIDAMASDAESAKIVAAVIGLGRSLGVVTVAEGVETEQTASLLRDLGCETGQGWLFGRPVPVDRIDAIWDAHPVEQQPVSLVA